MLNESSIERRLDELEHLLKNILIRLEKLEVALESLSPGISDILKVTGEILSLFSVPPLMAINAANKVLNIMRRYGRLDDISKAIIEVLSVEDEISISELTRRVKEIRGKASRRIIAERVRMLARKGIVVVERKGNRVLVRLKTN